MKLSAAHQNFENKYGFTIHPNQTKFKEWAEVNTFSLASLFPTINKNEIHHIDLTDVAAMKSPFYYIQPNDMILVKPLKRKAIGAGQTATQTLTTIASIFSVLVSTYFLAKNL